MRGTYKSYKCLVIILLVLAGCAAPRRVHAQFNGYNSPQGVTANKILNAVTTAQTVAVPQNLGQTFHFVTYTVAGSATLIQIRLDGSYDNSTWFAISDDATDLTQGEVVAIGYYPFLRVNLVQCVGCGGAVTVTANYSGTSSTSGTPWGFYNGSQQVRKVVFGRLTMGSNQSLTGIPAPYGTAGGYLVVLGQGGAFPGGSGISVTIHVGEFSQTLVSALPIGGTSIQTIGVPATPATTVDVSYASGGASANTISAYYFFYPYGQTPPPGNQPPRVLNSEAVSAVNTSISASQSAPGGIGKPYLYSVSARCSAGTANLTVTDGGTTIWSTAATEVGTTTFRFQWNPGLTVSLSSSALQVTLSTCGAGNTGTLDTQFSTF